MAYSPATERIWQTLLDLLRDNLPARCSEVAVPVPSVTLAAGMRIVADTTFLVYKGQRVRERTATYTDWDMQFDLEAWAFHPDAEALNRKALRYEWALRQVIEADRTLGGAALHCLCGDADGEILGDVGAGAGLVYGLLIPVEVRARVPYPEVAS